MTDTVNQYTYGRPILDKYGFKATFFEVCGWIVVVTIRLAKYICFTKGRHGYRGL